MNLTAELHAQTVPLATTADVGMTAPPAGSAVMDKREGHVVPAMVNTACRGEDPSTPSEMASLPTIPHS